MKRFQILYKIDYKYKKVSLFFYNLKIKLKIKFYQNLSEIVGMRNTGMFSSRFASTSSSA